MRKVVAFVGCCLLLTGTALAQEETAVEEQVQAEAEAAQSAMQMPPAGSIGFLELPALDPAAAGEFYSSLFGWVITTDEGHGMVFFNDPHGAMGSFTLVEEPSAGGSYTFYIAVESVSAKLEEIAAAGGTVILEEETLPEDWGVIGLFADPSGNVVGLWSP